MGILGANTLATYTLILACWQLGRPIALFNFRLAPAELTTQLKDAQPAVLLVDDSLPDWPGTLAHLPGPILSYPQLAQGPRASFTPVAEFNNHQVADVMYTSGSTGTPKGVLQTFGNHFYSAIGTGLNFKLTSDDAWVCAVPLFHISGLSILLRSLIYGLGVYLEPKFDPVHINQILVDQQGTIVSVVPYMLQQLLAHLPAGAHYNPHFKCLFLGGGPIDPQTLERCVQRGIPVVQSYGMTETASNVVALSFADAPNHICSAGKALFPVDLAIDSAIPRPLGKFCSRVPR
ncbi:O-succinylbenzoic acid-CoA ligase [Agrilactobacillus composti DSM 18527 = JCM 14202]|nr:O-succinylbenzoic acid-CoA ligase [Agrilactobacillus composti DSM 18527 = JCM 14202]